MVYWKMNINGFKITFLIEHNKYYIYKDCLSATGMLHLASPRGLFLAPFFSLFSSMIFHPALKTQMSQFMRMIQ